MKRLLVYTAVLFLFVSFSHRAAIAATQGTNGPTSTGTLFITMLITEIVNITALDDMVFPLYAGSGDLQGIDDICIYSTTTGGGYNVTATGDGGGGAFIISNGIGDIPFTALWNDVSGTSIGAVSLTPAVALTGQTGADTASLDCSGGTVLTSRLIVDILETDLQAAAVSNYTGSVMLTVAPE